MSNPEDFESISMEKYSYSRAPTQKHVSSEEDEGIISPPKNVDKGRLDRIMREIAEEEQESDEWIPSTGFSNRRGNDPLSMSAGKPTQGQGSLFDESPAKPSERKNFLTPSKLDEFRYDPARRDTDNASREGSNSLFGAFGASNSQSKPAQAVEGDKVKKGPTTFEALAGILKPSATSRKKDKKPLPFARAASAALPSGGSGKKEKKDEHAEMAGSSGLMHELINVAPNFAPKSVRNAVHQEDLNESESSYGFMWDQARLDAFAAETAAWRPPPMPMMRPLHEMDLMNPPPVALVPMEFPFGAPAPMAFMASCPPYMERAVSAPPDMMGGMPMMFPTPSTPLHPFPLHKRVDEMAEMLKLDAVERRIVCEYPEDATMIVNNIELLKKCEAPMLLKIHGYKLVPHEQGGHVSKQVSDVLVYHEGASKTMTEYLDMTKDHNTFVRDDLLFLTVNNVIESIVAMSRCGLEISDLTLDNIYLTAGNKDVKIFYVAEDLMPSRLFNEARNFNRNVSSFVSKGTSRVNVNYLQKEKISKFNCSLALLILRMTTLRNITRNEYYELLFRRVKLSGKETTGNLVEYLESTQYRYGDYLHLLVTKLLLFMPAGMGDKFSIERDLYPAWRYLRSFELPKHLTLHSKIAMPKDETREETLQMLHKSIAKQDPDRKLTNALQYRYRVSFHPQCEIHYSMIIISDSIMATGDFDGTIKFYCHTLAGMNKYKYLEAHSGPVYQLIRCSDEFIMSSSNDGEIKVWELTNLILFKTLKTIKKKRTCMDRVSDHTFVYTEEATIIFMNWMKDQVLLRIEKAHKTDITCIRYQKTLYSAAYDGTFHVWRIIGDYEHVKRVHNYTFAGKIRTFLVMPGYPNIVQVAMKGGKYAIYDMEQSDVIKTHQNMKTTKLNTLVAVRGDGILINRLDGVVNSCYFGSTQYKVEYKGSELMVTSFANDKKEPDKYLWGASLEESIFKWDVQTGNMLKVIKNQRNYKLGKVKCVQFDERLQYILVLFGQSLTIFNVFGEIKATFKLDKEMNCGTIATRSTKGAPSRHFFVVAPDQGKELVMIDLDKLQRCPNLVLDFDGELSVLNIFKYRGNGVVLFTRSRYLHMVNLLNGKLIPMYKGTPRVVRDVQLHPPAWSWILEESTKTTDLRLALTNDIFRRNKVKMVLRIKWDDPNKALHIVLLPSKRHMAFVMPNGRMSIWHPFKRKLIKNTKIPKKATVTTVSAVEKNVLVASFSDENKFNNLGYCFNWVTRQVLNDEPFTGHAHRVIAQKFFGQQNYLISVSEDAHIINTHLLNI